MGTIITKEDGFVWLILSREQAEILWDKMEVYCLYDDDSEGLIEYPEDLEHSDIYGIEVGFLKDLNKQYDNLIK